VYRVDRWLAYVPHDQRLRSEAVPFRIKPCVFSSIKFALLSPPFVIDFVPGAVMFRPNQYNSILVSDLGIIAWIIGMVAFGYTQGFLELFRVYLVPYFW
jgi:hypothetical protein